MWIPQNLNNGKSTLVQVITWRCQAKSHYLSHCWPKSMSPSGVTGPQWVNVYWNTSYDWPSGRPFHYCVWRLYHKISQYRRHKIFVYSFPTAVIFKRRLHNTATESPCRLHRGTIYVYIQSLRFVTCDKTCYRILWLVWGCMRAIINWSSVCWQQWGNLPAGDLLYLVGFMK